jgi:fused signal recognition particle receptor
MGFFNSISFQRLKDGLSKTRDNLFGKIQRIIAGKSKIDDDVLEGIEEVLIGGDVGVDATTKIIDNLRRRVREEGYEDTASLENLLKDEIVKMLSEGEGDGKNSALNQQAGKPYTILIVGVNGVGKTTTIGKLAHNYRNEGKRVIIAAADTFRAAANEQLEIWANRAGVDIIQQAHGADPAAVAFDALNAAIARNIDVLIIDTAGRLHTKVNLMEELKKIKRVLQKVDQNIPQEILLVLDASTGQNAFQQLRQFNAAVGVTGLIITKLDGTAKGGVVLGLTQEIKIPVKYIGVGEKITDLQPFDRNAFVTALCEHT